MWSPLRNGEHLARDRPSHFFRSSTDLTALFSGKRGWRFNNERRHKDPCDTFPVPPWLWSFFGFWASCKCEHVMCLFEVMTSLLYHALKVHSDHIIPGSHPPTPTGEHGGASQFRPYYSRVPSTHPNFNMVVLIFLKKTLFWKIIPGGDPTLE